MNSDTIDEDTCSVGKYHSRVHNEFIHMHLFEQIKMKNTVHDAAVWLTEDCLIVGALWQGGITSGFAYQHKCIVGFDLYYEICRQKQI